MLQEVCRTVFSQNVNFPIINRNINKNKNEYYLAIIIKMRLAYSRCTFPFSFRSPLPIVRNAPILGFAPFYLNLTCRLCFFFAHLAHLPLHQGLTSWKLLFIAVGVGKQNFT